MKTAVLPTSASPNKITLWVVFTIFYSVDTLFLFEITLAFSRVLSVPSKDFFMRCISEYFAPKPESIEECLELQLLSKIGAGVCGVCIYHSGER